MRSGNPALNQSTFANLPRVATGDTMTIQGVVGKTAICLALLMASASYVWGLFMQGSTAIQIWIFGGMIAGLILALITVFKKTAAPITTPLYCVAEGFCLGGISAFFEFVYPGIVVQAVGLTFFILLSLLTLYRMKIIQATENFKLGVAAATGGVFLLYLVSFVLGFFGIQIPYIHGNGWIGIGFSAVVCVVAALNLVLDFDFIEQGEAQGAPKYMEWYGAFGLMVTLVWLYLEILRLLTKLQSRD